MQTLHLEGSQKEAASALPRVEDSANVVGSASMDGVGELVSNRRTDAPQCL